MEAFFAKPALYQQCTVRDALTTAITLDIFHKNCDVLKLACVAQTINVLNSIILTEGETTILTPNYYVFEMYKVHRDAARMVCETETSPVYEKDGIAVDGIYSFASEKEGIVSVNIINTDMKKSREIELSFEGAVIYKEGTVLNGDSVMDHNSKEHPFSVLPKKADSPSGSGNVWKATVPPASISVYRFEK